MLLPAFRDRGLLNVGDPACLHISAGHLVSGYREKRIVGSPQNQVSARVCLLHYRKSRPVDERSSDVETDVDDVPGLKNREYKGLLYTRCRIFHPKLKH